MPTPAFAKEQTFIGDGSELERAQLRPRARLLERELCQWPSCKRCRFSEGKLPTSRLSTDLHQSEEFRMTLHRSHWTVRSFGSDGG